VVASEAIKRSGFDCYKIVYDTFHFFLGPDNENDVDAPSCLTGRTYHVSGVEASIPKEKWRDGERVLVTDADKMASRDQIDQIVALVTRVHLFRAVLRGRATDEPGRPGIGAEEEHRVFELSTRNLLEIGGRRSGCPARSS